MNYMNQNIDWNERTREIEHSEPAPVRSTRRKKQGFLRRVAALTLSAVLFGTVSAGTFYGVNALLPQEDSSAASVSAADSGAVLTSLASTSYSTTRYGMDVSDIAAEALPSVVAITNISVQEVQNFFNRFGPNGAGQTQLQETTSCGSGVIIANDGTWLYMVTNAHVVAGAQSVQVALHDNQVLPASLVGFDANEDLAVLKVDAQGLTPAEFGDSAALHIGDPVAAIGDPLGYRSTITDGIVSALDREVEVDGVTMVLIQTSAAINFGNSGGALINQYGQVVGITTIKIVTDDGSAEALGFAIPSTRVKYVVDALIDGREIQTGVFGFTVITSPTDSGGLEIREVDPASDAYTKGIRAGDVIVAANGQPVTGTQDLTRIKLSLGPGDIVTLTCLRDGTEYTVDVMLVDADLIQ